jgi:hypothetical protein
VSRYRWVDDRKAEQFSISMACTAAGVSTSSYYDWKVREGAGPTEAAVAEDELIAVIRRIHEANDATYGSHE